ncbi:hypothetical protein N7931_16800 [Catenovulum sp. 2E275]|uniref:hypothetical protein n=1 Tax=Catenovulum sp. 2E275 TaxID=2980497 RepID=UPI0021D0850B|nr:hypothetical protein [Catenovulum sp. 2E275]MCU4677284.1 hypothetical protein [Catenovulum sp. 2E275]
MSVIAICFVKANDELKVNLLRAEHHLPFSLKDYAELVDWTGRQIRPDKRGYIAASTPALVKRLGIADEVWLDLTQGIGLSFSHSVGQVQQLKNYAIAHKLKRIKGVKSLQAPS